MQIAGPDTSPCHHQAIQKFVHVVLQRMFFRNKSNQTYFGRRTCLGIQENGKIVEMPWMEIGTPAHIHTVTCTQSYLTTYPAFLL